MCVCVLTNKMAYCFVSVMEELFLIKVFIVTDLPIHVFFICLHLPKFMQFAVYIYIYICMYVK